MDWKEAGKTLIGKGLPFLGSMVGGKSGEGLGETIAGLLGVKSDPNEIMAAIEKDPSAAVKLKELETQIAIAEIDRDKAEIQHDTTSETQAAETIRIEASSQDAYVRRTRPMIMRMLFYLTAGIAVSIVGFAAFASPEKIKAVESLLTEMFLYVAGLTGTCVTGYTLSRMKEKNTAMNPQPGIVQTIMSGIRRPLWHRSH